MDEDVEHRRLRWARQYLEPIDPGQRLPQLAGARDELRHPWEQLVEPLLGCDQERVGGEEAPAVAHLPDPRLVDQVLRSGECGSRRCCEILVERDVDGVEEPGDLVEPALVEGPALPESRAVEMERGAALARL